MWVDQLLLTIHVLAAAAWIGAALALQVIAGRMGPSTAGAVVDQFARDAEAVGNTEDDRALLLVGPGAAWIWLGARSLIATTR